MELKIKAPKNVKIKITMKLLAAKLQSELQLLEILVPLFYKVSKIQYH